MSNLDEILQAARSLPPTDRKKLREILAAEEQRAAVTTQTASHRELEMSWLQEHEAEYAGQWLALEGHQLLAHGADAKQVYSQARAAGVEFPFVVFAEDQQQAQWGGWQ